MYFNGASLPGHSKVEKVESGHGVMELKEELHNQKLDLEVVKHTATKANAQQIQLVKR